MNITPAFPSFDIHLADLNQFILELVDAHEAGNIESWIDLEERVNAYFTPNRVDYISARAPGWRKMASYAEGITLVHVMCVFLGLYMMPEFLSMKIFKITCRTIFSCRKSLMASSACSGITHRLHRSSKRYYYIYPLICNHGRQL